MPRLIPFLALLITLCARMSFAFDPATLDAPALLFPPFDSTNIQGDVQFRWQSVTGATVYHLQVATTSQFRKPVLDTEIATTTFLDTEITPNRIYYWRVSTMNATDTSPWSVVYYFTTVLPHPGQPIPLTPELDARDVVSPAMLTWTPGLYATSSRVVVAVDSMSGVRLVDTVVAGDSLVVALPFDGTEYYWQVTGVNDQGTGPASPPRYFTSSGIKNAVVSPPIVDHFIALYPNPLRTTGTLQIPSHAHVVINDAVGRVMTEYEAEEEQRSEELDARTWPAGMYVCRTITNGSATRTVVIKER